MVKNIFSFCLFLFSFYLFSQEKSIDSLQTKVKNEHRLEQKLEIPIAKYAKSKPFYRLSYHSTIIDVWKNSLNNFNGLITKYIFESNKKRTKTDTIFKKYEINNLMSKKIVEEVENIKEIPDDKLIKGWKFGYDGITYELKLLNNKQYQEKSYWTPNSQDSTILEVNKIKIFLEDIKSITKMDSITLDFKKLYKSNHSYTDGSGWATFVMPNEVVSLNYLGNYRLPLGLNINFYQNKFKNTKLNIGIGMSYKRGLHGNYSFSTAIGKSGIINFKNYSDGLNISYEKSKLNYTNFGVLFEKYTLSYYGSINNKITLETGFVNQKNNNGLSFGISKRVKKIDLKTFYTVSIFDNKTTNYEVGISKRLRHKNKYYFDIDLYYEKIFDFNNFNVNIYFPLFSYRN